MEILPSSLVTDISSSFFSIIQANGEMLFAAMFLILAIAYVWSMFQPSPDQWGANSMSDDEKADYRDYAGRR